MTATENMTASFDSWSNASQWSSRGGTPPSNTSNWLPSNDPCPPGFRVPTQAEWAGVINVSLNPRTNAVGGSWTAGAGNWTNGVKYGPALFLPAAGSRSYSNGSLQVRGNVGFYWSSTVSNASNAHYMTFSSSGQNTAAPNKSDGFPVRCVADN